MNDDIARSELALRAKRGAALLDEEYPGWEAMIDLAALDLNGECQCVLGQIARTLFGDGWGVAFAEMRMMLTGNADHGQQREWSDAHGFTAHDPLGHIGESEQWTLLTEVWREEILARRHAIAGLVT